MDDGTLHLPAKVSQLTLQTVVAKIGEVARGRRARDRGHKDDSRSRARAYFE